MHHHHHLLHLLGLLGLLTTPVSAAQCPINGALLPAPRQLSTSPHVHASKQQLSAQLELALSGTLVGGWQTNATAFSIVVTDAGGDVPLWEFHHHYAANASVDVDGDTQFRVASITKVFTDLLLLKLGLGRDEPVTKYLPELAAAAAGGSPIAWDEVTLGALGDHMAAIPGAYGFTDDYTVAPYLEALGFPPLAAGDYPPCGVNGLSSTCTRAQNLAGMSQARPVFPPFSRPVYSTISFTLLGYIIEDVTGHTFEEVLETEIIQPLGMTNTGLRPKSATSGVIPPVPNLWGVDFGDNNPTTDSGGGMYSSANDLTLLLRGILSQSILRTPSQVRQWLTPTAATSSLHSLVGMPWEIVRTTNLTPAHPHTIDIYTKGGHVPGYTSRIGIIGDYGFGFTVLTAGPSDAVDPLTEAILSVFLPALEEAARDEAAAVYVGDFSTPANATAGGRLVLTMDDGPGLRLSELRSNGSDMITGLLALRGLWTGSTGGAEPDLRLYPAGISETVSGVYGASVREDWRLVIETEPVPSISELPSQKVYDKVCSTWMAHDILSYGGQPVDRFVFLKKGSEVVGIEVPFLRLTMAKQ